MSRYVASIPTSDSPSPVVIRTSISGGRRVYREGGGSSLLVRRGFSRGAHSHGRISRVSVDFSGGGRCIFDILSRGSQDGSKGGRGERERVTLSTETASGE